ncbi:MAG: MBL fold metallo-hydrolase [Clostridiales bacterium]|nr:MBL fold metallo-hydrolase [Clostridiales bacterium]
MYCTRKVTHDLTWVGGNDRRLAMFEGVYSVPGGVSYNSYLLIDDKTVLFDTVDRAVGDVFLENIAHVLAGRKLDYVVVQHMEPDHSALLMDLVLRYPELTIVCNDKIVRMIKQFFDFDIDSRVQVVGEGDVLTTGRHSFTFVMAPMVHWPEVMVTYDQTDKILFSADAFGTFGALNGALFADEVNFERDYLDEARRYYCNIVGKYGPQVQTLLKKASALDIQMICPLHGFVWRENIADYVQKYALWSSYTPEENGVMIAYASVYGNTERAAEIVACRLREAGVKTVMFDVSVTAASEIIAAAFRWSHLLFASTTYNAGVFVSMDELLRDLAAHNIQNRTVAFIENGSWAPTSGTQMRKILEGCKNLTFIEPALSLKSSLKTAQADELSAFVSAVAESVAKEPEKEAVLSDQQALFNLTYGLFVLSAKEGDKDNGCIINTAAQVTDAPQRISVTISKDTYTHAMIERTGVFNLSILSDQVPFDVFEKFGFQSGKEKEKFDGSVQTARAKNGVLYLTEYANTFISGKVVQVIDCGTHSLFIADITEKKVLDADKSVTYADYFDHIKPPRAPESEKKKGFVCKVCGYVYEGDVLPDDFICPICKHGAEDFEPLA